HPQNACSASTARKAAQSSCECPSTRYSDRECRAWRTPSMSVGCFNIEKRKPLARLAGTETAIDALSAVVAFQDRLAADDARMRITGLFFSLGGHAAFSRLILLTESDVATNEVASDLVRGAHRDEAASGGIDDDIARFCGGGDQPFDESDRLDMRVNGAIDSL